MKFAVLRSVTSLLSLVLWRGRQHWFLLLLTSLGMILVVTLVCTVPLLAGVMQTVVLRDVLTASPTNAELALHVNSQGLSSKGLLEDNQFANAMVQQHLKPYLANQSRFEVQAPEFPIIASEAPSYYTPVSLDGVTMQQVAPHVTLLQGRLPQTTNENIEIALTPPTAKALHVHLGSVFTLEATYYTAPLTFDLPQYSYTQHINLHLVGIFSVHTNDAFWHGNDFQPRFISRLWHYTALTTNQNLFNVIDRLTSATVTGTVYFQSDNLASLHWYYTLNPAQVSLDRLDDLIYQLAATQQVVAQANSSISAEVQPTLAQFDLRSSLLTTGVTQSALERFRNQYLVERIPIAIFALQIAALLLFFIVLMVELLVERQANVLAVMKSRGASEAQVFRSHVLQCGLLNLVALIVGPVLAYALVVIVAGWIGQNALNVLPTNILEALVHSREYALGAVGVMFVGMLIALFWASRTFVRATHRTLWQRLNLDVVAAVIALTGYGMALYLTNISGLLDVQTQALVATPITLIAPLFLVLAAMLLFLRVVPWVFRLGSRLAAHGRGAIAMLAVAHLARVPRYATRMALLLALSTAFVLFTLIFSATQEQRAGEVSSYQAGADFSGSIPATAPVLSLQEETQLYRHIPGVSAATVGVMEEETAGASYALLPLEVRAIDPGTFAQATIWPATNTRYPLPSLLSQLITARQAALQVGYVPAIVDSVAWNTLNLHVGETFDLHVQGTLANNIRYVALAEVPNIPTLNGSSSGDSGTNLLSGNMLVDYATFAAVQKHFLNSSPAVNYVWLQTTANPTALAHLHTILQTSALRLDNLNDRRTLLASMQSDPLYLNLVFLLALGAIAVLLVALLGNLLASWQSIRGRLAQFVVLRAMGTAARQIVGIVVLEQALVYVVGLCIGVGFGLLLAVTVVPTLIFSNAPGGSMLSNLTSNEFYRIQQAIPVQLVFPSSLVLALALLIIIGLLAVGVMSSIALRPAIGPVLRISEARPPVPFEREERNFVSMRSTAAQRARSSGFAFVPLVFGRIRQTWVLLLFISVGMIAAVMMVCTIPLLGAIMTTAGLRDTLNTSSANSEITLEASTLALSPQIVQNVQGQLDPYFRHSIGTYLKPTTSLSIEASGFIYTAADRLKTTHNINFYASTMEQVAPRLTLLQGRLPQVSGDDTLETVLTPEVAHKLGFKVGSIIPLTFTYTAQPQGNTPLTGTLRLRVVGLFHIKSASDYLWHGTTFLPDPHEASVNSYTVLLPSDALLATLNHMAAPAHAPALFLFYASTLLWDYQLNADHVTYTQLGDLSDRLSGLQEAIDTKYANSGTTASVTRANQFPYLMEASAYTPVYGSFNVIGTLNDYLNRVDVFRIPAATLVLLIVGLVLIFIISMADILVEHQANALAVLRSRGASATQLLAILLSQGISLGLLALLLGPPLALFVVTLLSQRLLNPAEQAAISIVMGNPLQALLTVIWYALAIFLLIVITISLVLRKAVQTNVLALRSETTRSRRTTLMQRLSLDGGAAIIALTAYGLSIYLSQLGNQLDASTRVLFAAPLSIAASLFLLLGCMLLFLRFFPFLLRLGTRWTLRGRGAISMLTLAQMSRSPHHAARLTLLLACAIALTIFTPVFAASQTQHINDVASYEVGADFSGDLPATAKPRSLAQETALYREIAGVKSATVGFTAEGFALGTTPTLPVQVKAVDVHTFASTAIWTQQDSTEPLSALLAQLSTQPQLTLQGIVPVIVDAAAQRELALTVGTPFTIAIASLPYTNLICMPVATVQHIPTINNSVSASGSNTSPAGILLDYTTYAAVYHDAIEVSQLKASPLLPLNHVWLRTSDDSTAIAQVRSALKSNALSLDHLADRRALGNALASDPLILNLLLFLWLGTVTALILALVGDVFASWVRVRTRLAQLVVLRVLGATPEQMMYLLTWEQGIVYATALLLGGAFGAMLSLMVIPTLVFTNTPISGALSGLNNGQFDLLQQVVPPQIMVPTALAPILLLLLAIFLFALLIMIGVTLRPSMGGVLRVSED